MTDHPRDLLPQAAAGTLPVADRIAVDRHLAACPACREEHRQWLALAGATRGAAAPGATVTPAADRDGDASDEAPARGPFAHLAVPKARRYRAVLEAFSAAREAFIVHLRPEELAARLDEPLSDALTSELDRLADWGNLRTLPDTARVATVEDFARRRLLYALTREGEAVEAAVATYRETVGRSAELQAVALEDIRRGLRTLVRLAGEDPLDPDRVDATLRDLETVFAGLAANAAAFMGSLTRAIDTAADGVEGFLAYKDQLIGYLQRFIRELVVASAEIAGLLDAVEEAGAGRLLDAAAMRRAADTLPGAVEAGAVPPDHGRQLAARWEGLRRWFRGSAASPSQAELLRSRARTAIADLLETVAVLHDRRAGRSNRAADYTALARWFAQAPAPDDAHRLWRVAFGLTSARHLTIDGPTLDARSERPVPAATPWAQSPPVHVSARLRRTGHHQRRGPVRMIDRSAAREALARRLVDEHTELDAARRALATGRPLRLSELQVDGDGFPLLLALLGEALTAGGRETTSADGTLRIRLEPTGDGRVAEIATPDGILRGHDHVLVVTAIADEAVVLPAPEPSRA